MDIKAEFNPKGINSENMFKVTKQDLEEKMRQKIMDKYPNIGDFTVEFITEENKFAFTGLDLWQIQGVLQ